MRVERTVDIPFQSFQNEVILPHPAGIRPGGKRREIVDDRIPDPEIIKINLDPFLDFVSQIPAVRSQWEYNITFGKQIDIAFNGSIVGSDHSRKFIVTDFRAQLQGDGGNQFFHQRRFFQPVQGINILEKVTPGKLFQSALFIAGIVDYIRVAAVKHSALTFLFFFKVSMKITQFTEGQRQQSVFEFSSCQRFRGPVHQFKRR